MLTTFQWHFSEMDFCSVPLFLGKLGLKWSCGLSQAPGELAEGKLGETTCHNGKKSKGKAETREKGIIDA